MSNKGAEKFPRNYRNYTKCIAEFFCHDQGNNIRIRHCPQCLLITIWLFNGKYKIVTSQENSL